MRSSLVVTWKSCKPDTEENLTAGFPVWPSRSSRPQALSAQSRRKSEKKSVKKIIEPVRMVCLCVWEVDSGRIWYSLRSEDGFQKNQDEMFWSFFEPFRVGSHFPPHIHSSINNLSEGTDILGTSWSRTHNHAVMRQTSHFSTLWRHCGHFLRRTPFGSLRISFFNGKGEKLRRNLFSSTIKLFSLI